VRVAVGDSRRLVRRQSRFGMRVVNNSGGARAYLIGQKARAMPSGDGSDGHVRSGVWAT
jgi:hypothetical protein